MSERRRYLYPVFAALLTATLGWWLVAERRPQAGKGATEPEAPAPRYYATRATLRTYAASGHRAARVNAKRLEYYAESDEWQLSQPRWRRQAGPKGNQPWQGRANRGTLSHDETRARLTGDVRLSTPGKHGPIQLFTDELWLYLPRDYAETDERVRIEAPHGRHQAQGARFWIGDERVNLLGEAEGIYVAQD